MSRLVRYLMVLAGCLLLTMPSGSTGCSDEPTVPKLKTCADVSFGFIGGSSLPRMQFVLGCSGGINETITGTGFDQFGRTLGYTYTVECSDGSQRQTGSVTNITYSNFGQALSWDYSVNGTPCGRRTAS